MFKGNNTIGVVLVGLCLVAAGIMIWAMATDRQLTYNGPRWLPWILMVIILGGSLWGVAQRWRGQGGASQWPSPTAGQRSLLDRIRGKNNNQPPLN